MAFVNPTRSDSWILAVITLMVVGALASPARAQMDCARDGERVPCDVADPNSIEVDRPSPPRSGPWRGWLDVLGGRARRGDVPDAAGPIFAPDGRLCWPHGDHVHCQPPAALPQCAAGRDCPGETPK